MKYRNRRLSADYLTNDKGIKTTEQGLADKASRGQGPKYVIVNGRALYTEADLDAWVAEQAARPVVLRRRRRSSRGAEQPAS